MKKGLVFTGILLNWAFIFLVFSKQYNFPLKLGIKDISSFVFLLMLGWFLTLLILCVFKKELQE